MPWFMKRSQLVALACAVVPWGLASPSHGADSRFAVTNSRGNYVHWIELLDADENPIDPADPRAAPYSPVHTCGKCHDYAAIAHGYHFLASRPPVDAAAGNVQPSDRPGEPWIWTDDRTGTLLPLSLRGWPGTYDPRQLGISAWELIGKFGRHQPGGGIGEAPEAMAAAGAAADQPAKEATAAAAGGSSRSPRWRLSGRLPIDCMSCHSAGGEYNIEEWRDQLAKQNFAWAATAASGLGSIAGSIAELPDDFDPAAAASPDSPWPAARYTAARLRGNKRVFFDIVRTPTNNACYACHTVRGIGSGTPPEWVCDEDVHVRAGIRCADCHRNDLGHHTVRGFEGERHPTGLPVSSLSCRGCHLGDSAAAASEAGRLGAPRPQHAGIPPLHFDKLSCTSCHCGPRPDSQATQQLTSLAHGLGLPSHDYSAALAPAVIAPVLLRDSGIVYPYRMTWPAFWGKLADGKITPLHPETAQEALRRVLRIRRGSTFTEAMSEAKLTDAEREQTLGADRATVADTELTDQERNKLATLQRTKASAEFRQRLAEALGRLRDATQQTPGDPVYLAGGRAYRLGADGQVEEFEHEAAQAYAWPLGHDVRPARSALGAQGCTECHRQGAAIFESQVTALGPAPDHAPRAWPMYELSGFDKRKLDAWSLAFLGRTAFKCAGFVSLAVVGGLFASLLLGGGVPGSVAGRWAGWRRVAYAAFLLSVVVLCATSLTSLLRWGAMAGWWLFAHLGGAGAFVLLLPLVGIAGHGSSRAARPVAEPAGSAAPFARFSLVLLLASGWVVSLTMLASMLSWFGTEGLQQLLVVHRYSGLATGVAALLHGMSVIVPRLRPRH